MGCGSDSNSVSTLRSSGGAITPPNSLMSAPAMKVRPAQISTTALHVGIAGQLAGDRQQAAADRGGNGVDRRTVDGDDGNTPIFDGQTDWITQGANSWIKTQPARVRPAVAATIAHALQCNSRVN